MKVRKYRIKPFFKDTLEFPEGVIEATNMYDAAVIYMEQHKQHLDAEIDADMDLVIQHMTRL